MKYLKISFSKITKTLPKSIWIWIFLIFLILDSTFLTLYNVYFTNKIYPNTFISGIYVGNLKLEDAVNKLTKNIKGPDTIKLSYNDKTYSILTQEIGLNYNFTDSVNQAYLLDRTGNILFDFLSRIEALIKPRYLGLSLNLDENKLAQSENILTKEILIAPIYPSAKIIDGKVEIDKGQKGVKVESDILRAEIGRSLARLSTTPVKIPTTTIDPSLNDIAVQNFGARASKFLGKSIDMTFEYQSFTLNDSDLVSFLNPEGFNDNNINSKIDDISSVVDRSPQNASFIYKDNKVVEFKPSLPGVGVDKEKLNEQIKSSLSDLEQNEDKKLSVNIPVNETKAKVSLEDVNNLGIKELIGRGSSTFFHSIASRVHNIGLAASKFNSALIGPGETLSFDKIVGDVSNYTGYQQAYIIQNGRTVLGDGGGVCQVSTTLFRAALNAGLPIVERRAHAYRVGYYEQDSPPGLDATVYVPTTDLKILNDTPGSILIQTTFSSKDYSLVFEIYGTSDGRKAVISKPIVSGTTPAPAPLYQDDPTLPTGVVKQVDFAANGAKISFNYTVTRDNQTIYQKQFISNYQPWQAVYLRGTGPVQ